MIHRPSFFTKEKEAFYKKNGYCVIENLFPLDMIQETVKELDDLHQTMFGINRQNIDTWEKWPLCPEGSSDIFTLPQTMWKNRLYEPLYNLMAFVCQTPELWVSTDRIQFKRPYFYTTKEGKVIERPDWHNKEPFIHIDVDPWTIESTYNGQYDDYTPQGLLALSDCSSGSFCCLPGHHTHVRNEYTSTYDEPKGHGAFRDYKKAFSSKDIVEVKLKAGDYLFWTPYLPHHANPKKDDQWRLVQYIRFVKAKNMFNYVQRDTKNGFLNGTRPSSWSTGFGGGPTREHLDIEVKHYKQMELSEPRHKKLLGLEPW